MKKGLAMARATAAMMLKLQQDMQAGVLPPVPDGCTAEQYAEFAEFLRPLTILGTPVTIRIVNGKDGGEV